VALLDMFVVAFPRHLTRLIVVGADAKIAPDVSRAVASFDAAAFS